MIECVYNSLYLTLKKVLILTPSGTSYPENCASVCNTLPSPTEMGLNLRDSFKTAFAYCALFKASFVTELCLVGKSI